METIKTLLKRYKGDYDKIEVYYPTGYGEHYPSTFNGNCEECDTWKEDWTVGLYALADEEDYNDTIMQGYEYMTFDDMYENKVEKVLLLMLTDTDDYYAACEERLDEAQSTVNELVKGDKSKADIIHSINSDTYGIAINSDMNIVIDDTSRIYYDEDVVNGLEYIINMN